MDAPRITPVDVQPDNRNADGGSRSDTGLGSEGDAGLNEARPSDTRDAVMVPDTRRFIDQGGMFEAPPPPMDTRPPEKG